MPKRSYLIILVAGILVFSAEALLAQPPPRMKNRKEARERIETLRLWKMIEFLDLTEEQWDKFLPLFHRFQEAQKELKAAKRDLFDSLKEELESKEPDQGKIRAILTELEKNQEALEKERKDFLIDSGKTLTLIQEARLLLFEREFEKKLRETIRKLRPQRGLRGFGEG